MNAMVGKLSAFAGCAMGLAFAAAAPLEMPEVFRDAARSPGGVLSFVTALEDEAFRTGNRARGAYARDTSWRR